MAHCSFVVQNENGEAMFLLHSSLLTESKVMLCSVLTCHVTGFIAANCHKAIFYFLQTGTKVRMLFGSPSYVLLEVAKADFLKNKHRNVLESKRQVVLNILIFHLK
jgi:hypothetical protein